MSDIHLLFQVKSLFHQTTIFYYRNDRNTFLKVSQPQRKSRAASCCNLISIQRASQLASTFIDRHRSIFPKWVSKPWWSWSRGLFINLKNSHKHSKWKMLWLLPIYTSVGLANPPTLLLKLQTKSKRPTVQEKRWVIPRPDWAQDEWWWIFTSDEENHLNFAMP